MQQYLMQQLQATQNAAQQESPYLTALGQDATGFLNKVQGVGGPKDYRDFKPGQFWHMESLQDRSKKRDELMNAGATGDAALAGGGGRAFMDLDKQNRKDEFTNNYAREFQDNVQTGTANAKNTQLALGEMEQARRSGVASSMGGLLGTAFSAENNKPTPMWQNLIMGGMAAAPGIISGLGGMGGQEQQPQGGFGGAGRPATGYGGMNPFAAPSAYSTINTYSSRPRSGSYR